MQTSLNNYDNKINGYFELQAAALSTLGLSVRAGEPFIKHRSIVIFVFITLAITIFPMLYYGLQHITDVYLATDIFAIFFQAFMSFFKLIILIYRRKEIATLVRKLHVQNAKYAGKEFELLAAENKKNINFSRLYNILTLLTFASSMCVPLVLAVIDYKVNDGFKPSTPLEFNYFLDDTKPLNYCAIWTCSGFAVYYSTRLAIAVDTIYSWLVHNIAAQFQILQYRCEKAASENNGNVSIKTLIDCINFHCMAIDNAEHLNRAYVEVVFVKFTISYLEICCLSYRFIRGTWHGNTPFRIVFLLAVCLQLASYCYGGEHVKYESENVATKIYMTFDWPKVHIDGRKLLLMVMMRAQRACRVSSFVFNVDWGLFVWVCKTAGSFVAMLKTLDN